MIGRVIAGRRAADPPAGTVVFLIGMRLNRPWRVRQWLPVAMAMPKMLRELAAQPELGLLGARTFVSGAVIGTVQYWRDEASLTAYASAAEQSHLPAWRAFNRRIRNNGNVGVYHETYVVDRCEAIYVNMPGTFGLAGATASADMAAAGQSAAYRLNRAIPDRPTVEPY